MLRTCTKIAHRHSLPIFHRRLRSRKNFLFGNQLWLFFCRTRHSTSLAIFGREEIAHLDALKIAILPGCNRRESRNVGAFNSSYLCHCGAGMPKKPRKCLGDCPESLWKVLRVLVPEDFWRHLQDSFLGITCI